MIVIVFGLPGSGKTYFASELASRIRGLHISSDSIREELNKHTYDEKDKMEVYKYMLKLIEGSNHTKNLILDGTFYKAEIRDWFKQKARSLNADLRFIEMKAEEELIKKRVSRIREKTQADFNVYLKIKSAFESMQEDHLILNSGQEDLSTMLERAENYLNSPNEPSPDQ